MMMMIIFPGKTEMTDCKKRDDISNSYFNNLTHFLDEFNYNKEIKFNY